MTVFNPEHDTPALAARLADNPEGLVIACYCAAWCGTCGLYQPAFDALAQRWPQHTFAWIDVEELPELLGEEDVEDFPTLLIQSGRGNVFFGPLLPHISHLEQLIERYEPDAPLVAEGPGLLAGLLPDPGH